MTDQFLKSSKAQTPHLNSLRALPSHHSHSHLTGVKLFPKVSRQRHSKWFTPLHLTAILLLITLPGMQTCPRPVSYTAINPVHLCTHAGSCWFSSLITWTHHNFVNTAQSSRASTAWQLRPRHGLLWIAYPKSHCFTVPGVAIASTRLQSHTDLLNPTWIWERLHLGWFGERVKALG